MSTDRFELFTASAEIVAQHVDADLRSKHWSHREKAKHFRHQKYRLLSEDQLMLNVILDRPRSPEVVAAVRLYVESEVRWLESNPGDDLTPERVEFLARLARESLPRATGLHEAVGWVAEVENESLALDQPSPTREILNRKLKEALDEISGYLADALTKADMEFLLAVQTRTARRRQRWRFERSLWASKTPMVRDSVRLVDVMLKASPVFATLEQLVVRAASLSEAKRLCECWRTPITVSVRDDAKIVVGQGFEILPVPAPAPERQPPAAQPPHPAANWLLGAKFN